MTTEVEPRLTYREMRTKAQELVDERIKEQVLEGLDALNRLYGPDWVNFVDPASLSMSNSDHCVLGQIGRKKNRNIRGYFSEVKDLALKDGERDHNVWGVNHGFFAYGDSPSYVKLQQAWKRVLS